MPTLKKRINITVDKELFLILSRMSKREQSSLSSLSSRLIKAAMELEEDRYFSKVSDERLQSNERRISHDKVWKK